MKDILELLRQTIYFADRYGTPAKKEENKALYLAQNAFFS